MTSAPQKTGLVEDTKGIFQAWWQGSRGTIWFWLVPIFVAFLVVTTILGFLR